MDTTTAAKQARVTIATIRTWCRRGAVAATKTGGRWDIDTRSLAHRIALTNPHLAGTSTRIQQHQSRSFATRGRRSWAAYVDDERLGLYDSPETAELAIARYAPYTPKTRTETAKSPAPRGWSKYSRRDRFVREQMSAFTGVASHTKGHECHYCGLDERTCDCY
jgi:hypothetical protein